MLPTPESPRRPLQTPTSEEQSQDGLIAQIEALAKGVAAQAERAAETNQWRPNTPSLTVQKATSRRRVRLDGSSGRLVHHADAPGTLAYRYGQRSGSRMLAVYLQVLAVAHENLVLDKQCTKRDLFYRHVSLFRNQRTVDAAVENIALTLRVPRRALRISASGKGVVYGNITLHVLGNDGAPSVVHGRQAAKGLLIPESDAIRAIEGDVRLVVVVEKEAVFHTLLSQLPPSWVAVTGKGYPDKATRHFLQRLALPATWATSNPPRLVVLTDCDPHGLDIACCYRFGSATLAHESSRLACAALEWVGLRPSVLSEQLQSLSSGLISLTAADRQKAVAMLARPWFRMSAIPAVRQLRLALQRLLFLGYKAELEILPFSELFGHLCARVS